MKLLTSMLVIISVIIITMILIIKLSSQVINEADELDNQE